MGHLFNVDVSTVCDERLFDICNGVIHEYIAHQLWKKWVHVRNAIKLSATDSNTFIKLTKPIKWHQ